MAPGFRLGAIFSASSGLLDGHVLDHHLDDPVALAQAGEVVLEVADLDAGEVGGQEEGDGFSFSSAASRRPGGDPVAVPAVLGNHVESRTRIPALARCAAMVAPMTPAPSTAARSIRIFRAFAPDESLVVMWPPGSACIDSGIASLLRDDKTRLRRSAS